MHPPDGFSNATFIFNADGYVRNCTWDLAFSDSNDNDAAIQANNLYTYWSDPGLPFHANNMNSDYTFVGVDVIKNVGGILLGGSYTNPIAGTQSTHSLPRNCAILVKKLTGRIGRKYRGRAFIPPMMVGEGDVDHNGIISSGVVASYQGFFNSAIGTMVTDGYQAVLLHSDASHPTDVTAMTVESLIATQRRRLR